MTLIDALVLTDVALAAVIVLVAGLLGYAVWRAAIWYRGWDRSL